MKYFLSFILIHIGVWSYSQTKPNTIVFLDDSTKTIIPTKLNLPFGTIVKLNVEIYDGENLNRKEYQGIYLLKINAINDIPQHDSLLLTFNDETGELANDDFGLYKLIYGKTAGSLSEKQIDKMKKLYVGKKLTVMAYETGLFTGTPKDYYKYQPMRADLNFHFKNYLVVVTLLTKQIIK